VSATLVLLGVLAYGVYGLSQGRPSYGGNLDKLLPKIQALPADHAVVGTYRQPGLTVSGDQIRVETPSFSALAVVTGPLVPGEGFTNQPKFVTSTWTVHVWGVTGHLPLTLADFDTIDHVSTEYHLQLVTGSTIPAFLSTGQQATFQVRTVMPIGEGLFRWAPNGDNIVAKWDFQVEND
jgi:hypothetical protein